MVDAVLLGVFPIAELLVREQHLLRVRQVEELGVYNIDSRFYTQIRPDRLYI